jgi:hypothetical protein
MMSGPSAFLALWNDVDPVRDAEYNAWHTYEHVPERVGVAGVVDGRRYHARERSDRRYFTRYDLDSLAALNGPAYADVVENPTAWSRSMRPSLRNFFRQPCAVVARLGGGCGGSVVTFRFGVDAKSLLQTGAAALQSFVGTAGITAILVGHADAGAAFPLANSATAAATNGVALVDGPDRAALEVAAPTIAGALHEALRAEAVAWEAYDLAFVCTRSDLADPFAQRQPPREDLRRQWQSP